MFEDLQSYIQTDICAWDCNSEGKRWTFCLQLQRTHYAVLRVLVRARLVDYLFPMSKVLKIRVGRSGKKKRKKKAEVPIIGYQISLFVTEMLPMPWQEVQICVHDVHVTHFPLYYSSACSYRKLCRFEKC